MQDDNAGRDGPRSMPLCDIVMEGGVTSGIIYPKAVCELAREFRLKNIGGTSVGALAAAITAAAELGRLRAPDNPGYARLSRLSDELGKPARLTHGATRLFDLFQPQRQTRALFNILAAALNRGGKWVRVLHIVLAAIRNYAIVFACAAGIVVLIQWLFGGDNLANWSIAGLFALVCGIAAVGYAVWRTMTGPFSANGFGLCTGYLQDRPVPETVGDDEAPLTLWLSREINRCAGMLPDGPPLTFDALWTPGGEASRPPPWLREAGIETWRYIDLQTISTNVTHGRPYRFPHTDEDQELFFKPAELEAWFPPNVIQHMKDSAASYAQDGSKPPLAPGLFKLPPAGKLPVVFAARLSLSFPLLLSAVPLYAIDEEPDDVASRQFKRCWFSDGGICSNFPIHLFDSPLPLWPTFGIVLEDERKFHPIQENDALSPFRFFLPGNNAAGRGETFARFDDAAKGGTRLFGFLASMLDTARNWQDRVLSRAPAVRDRVVRVYLKADEGGLNLNMPKDVLATLSAAGGEAARMLAGRFCPGSTDAMNFDNHRWMRMRNLTRVIEADMDSFHSAMIAQRAAWLQPAGKLIDTRTAGSEATGLGADPAQQEKIRTLMAQLDQLSVTAASHKDLLRRDAPLRTPVLRIVPDI